MDDRTKALLVDLAGLTTPRDSSDAERSRFWHALGALQGRAELALMGARRNGGFCETRGCFGYGAVEGLCREHAAAKAAS